MKEKKKTYPNPRFSSIEEEEKYWATHSPLDKGYAAEMQKEKQKRSSFLTIRLTGDELARLRDVASSKGLGPSTYIRALIKENLTPQESAALSLRESLKRFESVVHEIANDRKVNRTMIAKDKSKEQYEA
jgi:predicted DNA binding CopG/RHH family protein